ncbi:ABC transporter ATP-binding protein [Paraburkholderia sp. BL21I4N1]|uniref:ABC transporter ATP-binding protein n=1 Tax=Paraburkholderia sp. BL21I4N1 TaxID=1938801 RepID=UPI000CFD2CDC|nr:ABC transporter ATP-binding protein [Paraburkholderia sp. BL21I4N1]PQV42986.1 mannopine transport system ATP-binding protein [Paraburkholderia sp. BL21I4N1]
MNTKQPTAALAVSNPAEQGRAGSVKDASQPSSRVAAAIDGAPIRIENLAKRYGSTAAVSGIDLDVRAGEFLSLLGPSGSGKTTLLMMLAGFELPSEGRLTLDTSDITRIAPNKRNIGMVFQRYALFPHMTVSQNVAYPLRMRKVPKAEIPDRVERALSMVGLNGFGDRMPNQLSGGQQQRVAVARALVFEPPVLLMDEPLSALDKKMRERMQIEIKQLQQRLGVTVVYVTHDQEEALTMSDRIAVMDNGRIQQVGTAFELYERPATPFVADFIGKMNFIPSSCMAVDDESVTVRVAGDVLIRLPQHHVRDGMSPLVGDRLDLAIRPERVRIERARQGVASSITGVVEARAYVGAFQWYVVRLADGTVLHVQSQSGASAEQGFDERQAVDITFEPTALHVFRGG